MCLQHYLHFYSQEHVMCPTHVECQKFHPKPTIKCFTKNHRLFMHNENYIVAR